MKKLLLVLGLLAGATQLFALSNFMKNTVFVVKGCIKDFSDIGINQTIVGSRVADSNPLDLQVGDIFVDVEGNAQRVTKITRNGNNITIDTETPEVADIFKYIRVPHQTTNFNDYEDDAITYSSYMREADDDNWINVEDGPMIEAFMPEDSKKFEITLNFSDDIKDYTKNVQDELDVLDELIELAKATNNDKKAKDMKDMSAMMRMKNATNNVSKNLDLTLGVQYKKTENEIEYDYGYSLPGWNTHGSRLPWKWSWESGGGYASVAYRNEFDFGFYFDIFGYIDKYYSAPIPGLAYGADNFGPYVGIYFDFEIYGGFGANVSFYKHVESTTSYQKKFTAYLTSDGEPRKVVNIWSPNAWQLYGQAGGELTIGPSFKFGFVALGVNLAQGKASAGGYADAEVCIGYTWIDKDEEGAKNLQIDVDTSPVLNELNENGKWEPKYESGFTFFGDFALGLFARLTFEVWDGKWSTTPLDYKIPIFSNNGYNNSFTEGNWFENMEGSGWFNSAL